jgi:hypothetical protein
MAKSNTPTNIAMALKCATKVQQGKACTVGELRATVLLLKSGMSGARSSTKIAKNALRESKELVSQLLSRIAR